MAVQYKHGLKVDSFRRKAILTAKERGYSADILEQLIKARDIPEIKIALDMGEREFKRYKREAIVTVGDFGYGDDILNRVKNAKTTRDITIVLNEARRNFDFEVKESLEDYERRISKDSY